MLKMEYVNHKWNLFVNGENSSLGELYNDLFEPLVFKAYVQIRDIDAARDIVAELFSFLLDTSPGVRYQKWKDVNSFEAYINKSVYFKCIDHLRKHNKNQSIDKIHSFYYELEETLSIDDFFLELPEKDKRLFQLHLDGFQNKELADHYNLSEKTIRNRLSLTRKKIAASIKTILILSI